MDKRTQDKHLRAIELALRVAKGEAGAMREIKQAHRSRRCVFEAALLALVAFGFHETAMESMNTGYQMGKESALGDQVERHTAILDFVREKDAEKPLGRGLGALIPANNDFEPQNTEWGNIGMGLNKTDRDIMAAV